MADMISRKAAIAELMSMVKAHEREIFRGELLHYTGIKAMLDAQPTVDAEPVVRCRDCKYGKLCFYADGQRLIQCTNPYYPASFAKTWPFDLDWYCAGGERRE